MRLTVRPTVVLAMGALAFGSISLVSAAAAPAAAADTVVLEQDFEGGESAGLSPLWTSDNPTLEWVQDPDSSDNTVLRITDRAQNHFSVSTPGEVAEETFLEVGTEYSVSMRVRLGSAADSPQDVQITENENYQRLGGTNSSASVTGDAWTQLEGTYTPGAAQMSVYPDAPAEVDLLVDDFVVTTSDAGGGDATLCPAGTDEVANHGFEDGTDGWQSRGDAATEATADDARSGDQSLAVTGRTANWHGAELPVAELFTGGTYTISAWVKLPAGAAADDLKLTVQGNDGTEDSYTEVAPSTAVTDDAWVNLCGSYTVSKGDTPAVLYVEAADTATEFYLDDVHISTDGGAVDPCVVDIVELASYDFEDGTDPWKGRTANATLGEEGRGSASSLSISGRTDAWNGAQLDVTEMFAAGTTYTVTSFVKFADAADNGETINMGVHQPGADNEYPRVGEPREATAAEWVELSGTYTVDAATPPQIVYIESSSADADFLVDDVSITYQSSCDDGPAPGTVALSTDFEDGLDGWGPRNVEAGEHVVEVTDTESHGGESSALVRDRYTQGSGLGIDVTELMEPNSEYEISAWIKFADGQETDNVVLSMQQTTGTSSSFANLVTAENMSNSEWVQMTGTFSSGAWESAYLYFETEWEAEGVAANISDFLVDDIVISVPEAAAVQDLLPLKDTLDMPVGVAVDSRETSGGAAALTLRHFNQITAENHMKVEAWYDADQNFRRHSEATALLDFAVANDLDLFGHVLVWHSQSPDWFFQDEAGNPLTDSDEDKQFLRERLRTHIFNVAESIADDYGPYGSAGNPVTGWDVVNEVVSDQATPDGLRQSELYDVLGEEYIHLAYQYADEAFNNEHAADGSDRPVLLYINDYNTEQPLKGDQYEALVRRMVDAGTPLDGVGHQFHLGINASVAAMRATMDRFVGLGKRQAITEFDVTINPANEANRVRQGHFYRDAFEMFRDYHAGAPASENLSSITIWGLTDTRSWRSEQQPLMFDGDLQAKYAYYGAVGDEENLPGLITTANVFGGDVALTPGFHEAIEWSNLPEHPLTGGVGGFQTRWNDDHLTVLVRSTAEPERIEFTYNGSDYAYDLAASDSLAGSSATVGAETFSAVQLPHDGVSQGDTAQFDVRVVAEGDVIGAWNSSGDVGQLTFLEPLSTLESPQLPAPGVDGLVDDVWADIPTVRTGNTVEGNSEGAYADVRTLWKDDTLYVLYEVTDSVIDSTNSDPWNKDGVELFLDLGNTKEGTYGANDTQIRVTIEGDLSFGTGNTGLQESRVADYAVKMTEAGYNVEFAIDLIGQSGGQSDVPLGALNAFHGIDFQVNDGREGARYSVHTWAEPTGTGYQNTDRWGVLHQVGELADDGGDNGDGTGDGGDGNGTGDNGDGSGDGGDGTGSGDGTWPLPEDDVRLQGDGNIEMPGSARAGSTITIHVGTQHAGTASQTFIYSEPTLVGQSIVDADGNVRVTIPLDTEPGSHTIAVYDMDGNLLGWAAIDILAADGSLATTGANGFLLPLSIGLLLMLTGMAMVGRRQRVSTVR